MKKLLFLLLVGSLSATALEAQNPKIARTNAYNAYQDYLQDTLHNVKMLAEAHKEIEIAIASPEVASDPKTWLYRGQIYTAMMNNFLFAAKTPNMSLEAANSFLKVVELDTKRKSTTEVHQGILITIIGLFNDGGSAYNAQKYGEAFNFFNTAIKCYEGLVTYMNGKYTPADFRQELQGAAGINDLYYQTAIAAMNAQKNDDAEKLFKKVLDDKVDITSLSKEAQTERVANVYGFLFDLYKGTNMDKAMSMLSEGRKNYPDNQTLLIKSIQVAIEAGRIGDIEGDLKKAIANDPKNASLHFALGTVYDERLKSTRKAFNEAKEEGAKNAKRAEVDELMKQTKATYEAATVADPKFIDAWYNLGVIHFNHAVEMNNEVAQIQDTKLYKQKMAETKPVIDGFYNQAVPYFQKVYEIGSASNNSTDRQNAALACANLRDLFTRLENEDEALKYSRLYKELSGK